MRYDRWYWPLNRTFVPGYRHEALQQLFPTDVSYSTSAGALEGFRAYLGRVVAQGGVPSNALELFANLYQYVPDSYRWERDYSPDRLRVEWELTEPMSWSASDGEGVVKLGVKLRMMVRCRVVATVPRIERNDEGWQRTTVETHHLTEWNEPADRGWLCSPELDHVSLAWGDQAPILERAMIERERDQARVERWTQGQLALQRILSPPLEQPPPHIPPETDR